MSLSLSILINGNDRSFPDLTTPAKLNVVIEILELKSDRIAVEHNGEIAPRALWPEIAVNTGDRLEIVHFVGGGSATL